MVNNYARILDEIKKQAHQVAGTYGMEPQTLVELIMDIVDLEDRDRVKAVPGIKQKIKGRIENATPVDRTMEVA